ncbi:MAG: D-alanyl-D-alanine carboxypeptidase family protein [Oliverpabstia sp.]|nr:D-alanyl-D-alanine carboxypeptidase family protein [Oliverpabstia sp.]
MRKWYKKAGCLLLACLLLCQNVVILAAEIHNGTVYPIETNAISGWPQGQDTYAETAVLMEAETGAVLYAKGMNELRYPASITKIMTALLAIENCSMDEQVTFTEACLADQEPGSGNAGMKVGEILTMKQCLLVLMIKSANDVATQIAVHVGGSVAGFADLMNQRAQQLGCVNTHFVNASGMPDENHYTTAYDMALIFREAIKNELFREIISTLSVTIEPTNMNPEARSYNTHHALLSPSAPEHYEGCFGGKTGNTDASRCTLVSGAERNGMTLIAVALRADAGEVCQDHIQMFDYGYNNFEKIQVSGGCVVVPKGTELSALKVVDTEIEGKTEQTYYYQNDIYVGNGVKGEESVDEVPIEITPEYSSMEDEKLSVLEESQSGTENRDSKKNIFYLIIDILIGLIVLALLITAYASVKNRKRRRKRKNRGRKS